MSLPGAEAFLRILTVLKVSKTTAYISPYCISSMPHLRKAIISPCNIVGSIE
nr:MAG TPA_asm: hypothetical protein [Caudoviricetes sp.]